MRLLVANIRGAIEVAVREIEGTGALNVLPVLNSDTKVSFFADQQVVTAVKKLSMIVSIEGLEDVPR